MSETDQAREDRWLRYDRYPFLLAKTVFFLLVGAAAYLSLHSIQDVLFPVFASMILAYLLDPSVHWFERRGQSRTTGIVILLAAGGSGLAVFLLFLYPTVAHLLSRVGSGLPRALDALQTSAIPWVRDTLQVEVPETLDAWLAEYGAVAKDALPGALRSLTGAVAEVWQSTSALVSSLLNLVLVPVLTFYFLRDFDQYRAAGADLLPIHNREWLLARFRSMDEVVGAWFRGQVEVAAILAVLYAVGLGLTFGLSGIGATNGVALGLLSGLLNVVPYLGFVIGFVLSVLLAVLDFAGWGALAGVGLTFAVVQGLEGYVVTPRVVGEKVGLSPVLVILALLLGGEILGPLGVVLALPVAGSLRVLLPDLLAWYRESDLYTGVARRSHVRSLDPGAGPAAGLRSPEGGAGGPGGSPEPGPVGAPGRPPPESPQGAAGDGRVPGGAAARPEPDPPRDPAQPADVQGGEGAS